MEQGNVEAQSVESKSPGIFWPLVIALLLGLVLAPFPRLPLGADDDSSWNAVLGYAHEKGLQFGTDIVFTYGPLGFLTTPYLWPQTALLRLFTDLAVSFTSLAGLALVAWRMKVFWRLLLLAVFVLLAANTEPRTELLLNIGLLSWGVLCLVDTGPRLLLYALLFVAVGVFGVLAKATFLFSVGLGLAIIALDSVLQGRSGTGFWLVLAFGLGLVGAWLALGQNLAQLGPFFWKSLAISIGYQKTMGLEEFPLLAWIALAMVILAAAATALLSLGSDSTITKRPKARRVLVIAWMCGWLFLAWKLGFVRGGRDHLVFFLGFVPALPLVLEALPGGSWGARLGARGLALANCALAFVVLWELFPGHFDSCLTRPLALAADHASTLRKPAAYWKRLAEMQEAERAAMQLPRLRSKVGQARVDVIGFNQSYAIFNGLNYGPRPVFQSYAAYSRPLMRLNEDFYFSKAAPQYVLFRLLAIDDRFPPLEDALLFRDLLLNYEPLDAEGPFLLLKAREPAPPVLRFVREGAIRPGELIDLREYSTADLWVEVNIKPTWLGQIRALFYQPPPVQLGVWLPGDKNLRMAKFRAPAPMLAAGFLASPLQLDNEDVLNLYTGNELTRPVALSVELANSTRRFWEDSVSFRIYRIESRLGRCAPRGLVRLVRFPGFDVAPLEVSARTNAVIEVAGKPALYVAPGGFMRFAVPDAAKLFRGKFGFAPAAYTLGGATEGAQFRIEQQLANGTRQLLYSQTLTPVTNPADRGLQPFAVPCPGEGQRQLVLSALPVSSGNSPWDVTCWAEVGFE